MPPELNPYRRYVLMFLVNLAVVIGVIYLLRRDEPRQLQITIPLRASPSALSTPYGTVATLFSTAAPFPSATGGTIEPSFPTRTAPSRTLTPRTTEPLSPSTTPITRRINVNTASLQELMSLPRIGETIAQRIIEYREQHNGFKTIEEIKEVRGIGDAVFEDIKDLISVD